jgi:hypothetical protein
MHGLDKETEHAKPAEAPAMEAHPRADHAPAQGFTSQGHVPTVGAEQQSADHPALSASDLAYGDPSTHKVAKLHLFTDIEAKSMGLKELQDHRVGHTWIAIEYNDPTKVPDTVHPAHKNYLKNPSRYADSMGFWPGATPHQDPRRLDESHRFSANPLHSYGPGELHQPDTAHQGQEKASETWDLTQAEVDAVIHYAESKRHAQYSVYMYNCTTFATEAVRAAGKSAPPMSICMPNALYSAIQARQAHNVGDTMTKQFDGSNEVDVHGSDDSARTHQ